MLSLTLVNLKEKMFGWVVNKRGGCKKETAKMVKQRRLCFKAKILRQKESKKEKKKERQKEHKRVREREREMER